jgi:hypothetical protein
VDLERRAGDRRLNESRDDHPVLAALARSDGVEEAGDHELEVPLLPVGECQVLVHRLRVRVQPALLGRRPVDTARVLAERVGRAVIAVDLRGRRDEHPLAEACAVVEHVLGAVEVRHDRVHRALDDQARADGRGEVVHDVDLVHELVDDRVRQDGVDDEMEPGVLP